MKLNFPEATVLKMDVSDFATSAATLSDIVDVMHISYPCQGHSLRNHQTNPEQDARNISVAYGTFGLILRNRKPRIITLEQVRGIMQRSDGQHLRAQISDLVEAGYSVRWSLLNLAEYENVQARARVIVIASCPGQELPSFPAKTHGPGLKPLVTIRDILAQVPQHPPSIMSHAVKRNFPAYNPDVPLRGCITSGGVTQKSGGYHPNGRRDFNLQEMAQMQGFSADHRFYGNITSIRRQIGNAVPPVFAKKLFKSIIPALEETDKKMEAWNKVIEL
jgi:site-specific DNA-cytosine methylase